MSAQLYPRPLQDLQSCKCKQIVAGLKGVQQTLSLHSSYTSMPA